MRRVKAQKLPPGKLKSFSATTNHVNAPLYLKKKRQIVYLLDSIVPDDMIR